jgi:phage terminase large subunit
MSRPEESFNFKNPDYTAVILARIERLQRLRENPAMIPALKLYYRENPWQFVSDWGVTFDPRNPERGLPTVTPFVLFPKQVDWMKWVFESWKKQRPGITEKSRDAGISWCAVSLSCALCLFNEGLHIGFGSRKEEYVDKPIPKSLFFKARQFMAHLPPEFRGAWDLNKHAPHMRIEFPDSGSYMSGEAGDNIGRGDRASIYFVDESAHLERPQLIDASLSATTNCRQDVSSVKGMANPFAEKRHSWPDEQIFIFDWRDDPRKDDAWYAKQVKDLDPVIVAQEIDRDYLSSLEGQIIPSAWVQASIDAHIKLGIKPTGVRKSVLDVADRGVDKNAMCFRHSFLIEDVDQWSGRGSDIFETTARAFRECDARAGYDGFRFDADGLGASVRGDARVINEERAKLRMRPLSVTEFRGSAGVLNPEDIVPRTTRTNQDFFENYKAQSYWALRYRFEATYNAVVKGLPFNEGDIIAIPSGLKYRAKLVSELSQPVVKYSKTGKVMVDKTPEGALSPNLADAVMMAFAPSNDPMVITDGILELFSNG